MENYNPVYLMDLGRHEQYLREFLKEDNNDYLEELINETFENDTQDVGKFMKFLRKQHSTEKIEKIKYIL